MADDYKESAHWQALNRIWKAIPAAAREAVKDDFKLMTDFVKESGAPTLAAPAEAPAPAEYGFENRYLDGLSKAAKGYALSRLMTGLGDAYREILDFVSQNKLRDMDAAWERYAAAIEIPPESVPAVRELLCVCLERARMQGIV
jgi:hypothetical protein